MYMWECFEYFLSVYMCILANVHGYNIYSGATSP